MREVWKIIPGFEGDYEVSNLGRVRSVDRVKTDAIGRQYSYRGKIRKLHPHNKTGHLQVGLGHKIFKVHTLVLVTFVGPRPPGFEARHKDGNETNNTLSNLTWSTRSDNTKDRKWHKGADGYHKLSGEQARDIKKRLRSGVSQSQIARDYAVSKHTIWCIAVGETHVDA